MYRDLNDLPSKNRRLETHFQALLGGLGRTGAVVMTAQETEATAICMVVLPSCWLSFGYVRNPRHAMEQAIRLAPRHAEARIALAAFQAEVLTRSAR